MKKLTHISVLVFSILFSFIAHGQDFSMKKTIETPPSPAKLVNDYAKVLTDDQRQALETKLVRFDDSTTTQITVVIVPRLDGEDIADAATELGRKWGVGQAKNNNGVVLLISEEDRKLNISPGYGLEGALPDITCKQIIDDIIVPKFKGKDYYRGIDEGTDAIMQASKGQFTAPPGYNSRKKGTSAGRIMFIIFLIIIFLAITSGGSKGGGSFMSRRGFTAWTIGNMLGGGSGSGGGWSGGGGGSSGGFGGFGGGSFGGGGSSGSW